MSSVVAQNIIECLGWTLVHFIWQGAVIAAVLAVILRGCNRASADLRYAFGCIALLLTATAPVATFSLIHGGAEISSAQIVVARDLPVPRGMDGGEIFPPAPHSIRRILPTIHLDWTERLARMLPLLVILWAAGVLVFSLRLAAAWVRVNLLKRRFASPCDQPWPNKLVELSRRLGVHRPVRLLQSALVEVPAVIGWLRPVILLPASSFIGLSPAQLEAILAHELAHIRRHDYLVNVCQTVLETILFYHPAVWWISHQVRAEREHCCDDLAVEICGDRLNYARALATLEELRQPPAQLALAASGAPLLHRIQRLIASPAANPVRPAWPFAGILILSLLTLVAAGLRGEHTQADDTSSVTGPGTYDPYFVRQNHVNTLQEAANAPGAAVVLTNAAGDHLAATHTDHPVSVHGRQRILFLLQQIHVDPTQFDHARLDKAITQLSKISQDQDPKHVGINFLVEYSTNDQERTGDIRINLTPGLTNVTLAGLLDAITLTTGAQRIDPVTGSAQHLRYTVKEYAIEFSWGPSTPINLVMETFKLSHGLKDLRTKSRENVTEDDLSGTNTTMLRKHFQKFFEDAGVDLNTNNPANVGKAFVWNDRRGILMVRVTAQDLDRIKAALGTAQVVTNAEDTWIMSHGVLRPGRASDASGAVEAAVDTKTFYLAGSALNDTLKENPGAMEVGPNGRHFYRPAAMQKFLADIGINLVTNSYGHKSETFLWDLKRGELIVCATSEKLAKIEGALSQLSSSGSQSNQPVSLSARTNPKNSPFETRVFYFTREFLNKWNNSSSAIAFDEKPEKLSARVRQFFSDIGVDVDTSYPANSGKAFVWNERKGILMVRATPQDLDWIEAALETVQTATNIETDPTKPKEELTRDASSPTVTNSASQVPPLNLGHLVLETRVFHLTNFLVTLKNSQGAPLTGEPSGEKKPLPIWQFLRDIGVDLDTNNPANAGKAIVWNDRKDHLMVRATAYDLNRIEAGLGLVQFVSENPAPILSYHIYHVNSDVFRTPTSIHDDSAWKEFNALRQHLTSVGVAPSIIKSLVLGETCFTDPPHGLVMFRGTPADLEAIDAGMSRLATPSPRSVWLINRLAASKPEINIKIEIVAVDEEKTHKPEIDWLFANNELSHREISEPIAALQNFPSATNSISSAAHPVANSIISQVTGVLSATDYKARRAKLENTYDVDVFRMPEVTTALGQQGEVMAVDEFTVVTGATANTSGKKPTVTFSTENLYFGPIVDVLPDLNDTNAIDLRVTASIGEFAGYAGSIKTVLWSPKYFSYEEPHPQFRLRQMRTEKSVRNGETLVLAGLSALESNIAKSKIVMDNAPAEASPFSTSTPGKKTKNHLVIFITPTLINPDGTLWTGTAK